jgi:hypothetical protein
VDAGDAARLCVGGRKEQQSNGEQAEGVTHTGIAGPRLNDGETHAGGGPSYNHHGRHG